MTPSTALLPASSQDDEALELALYAEQAYLEYALSVVKGRALPDVTDGQKPVQRRILYSMSRMGLGYSGADHHTPARPVKSARVVGDVLGRFHPHSDQAAYDALVRMAQDFSQRYPLIDGQGNFGSRDGDGAAAMRYTEARLARISSLLLAEIDMGTVDFVANYDGSAQEPVQLPARLPFNLLNGASGIAVGMATEIPSHNIVEVAAACIALIKDAQLPDAALFTLLPAPDYPGGGQIISSKAEMAAAYTSGRGSLKVRARWHIEPLARGQWQMVVDELPPSVSVAQIMSEIEELSNPKIKAGKKALSAEQVQLKTSFLAMVDAVRDESNKDALVRIVIEPKSAKTDPAELAHALLARTSLESTAPINLTAVGLDGKPVQKRLRQMLMEWIAFRTRTIERRSRHRFEHVGDRLHILQGRQLVLLSLDEVIHIIRTYDAPKAELMARFALTERQCEDILEIRLRQLAKLEFIKIEQEIKALQQEQQKLQDIIESPASLRRLMVKEIEQDAKTYADPRRTLVLEEKRAVAEPKIVDEAVTVIVSLKGWLRVQKGHEVDPQTLCFKSGDALYGTFACRSLDTLLVFGATQSDSVRVYSMAISALPGGRGDGQPIQSLIDAEVGVSLQHYYAGSSEQCLLLASSGGYGFYASVGEMTSRHKSGKSFIKLAPGEGLLAPVLMTASQAEGTSQERVLCVSMQGRLLGFACAQLRRLATGGRGLMLQALDEGDQMVDVALVDPMQAAITVRGLGRGGKERAERVDAKTLALVTAQRGKKGKALGVNFKVTGFS